MPDSPIQIDPRYVDVDFPREKPFVFGDLGSSLFSAKPPNYEDAVGLIPESQWQSEIERIDQVGGWLEWFIRIIMNQGNEGSCVSFATTYAFEILVAQQHGLEAIVPMSPMSLYKRIGSSSGSGSNLSDALDEMQTIGFLPENTPENVARFKHTHPRTGFSNRLPDNYKETAKLFVILEWFDIRTLAGIVSASLRGTPIVVGRQGHSICYVRPSLRNSQIGFNYVNSWGNWGYKLANFTSGFGFDSLSTVKQSARWAFALRSVKSELRLAA